MLARLRRHRPSPAMVVALFALVVALSGSSYAAVTLSNNSVKSKHIAKGAVKRSDIGKGAVNSAKVADFSLLAKDFQSGQLPFGPQGIQGIQGVQGDKGDGRARHQRVCGRSGDHREQFGLAKGARAVMPGRQVDPRRRQQHLGRNHRSRHQPGWSGPRFGAHGKPMRRKSPRKLATGQ